VHNVQSSEGGLVTAAVLVRRRDSYRGQAPSGTQLDGRPAGLPAFVGPCGEFGKFCIQPSSYIYVYIYIYVCVCVCVCARAPVTHSD